ncbi:MAG: hypothetical protein LBN95_02885 [Prevotellaceae bacterium]|jgi:uncharacterized protein with PIN domain|nr:hypothetical protein [Prevotellaceae bacterium]
MDSQKTCDFCGKSNLKIQGVYKGLFDRKVGEEVVVDTSISMYRCSHCGRILCGSCSKSLGAFKKKRHILSTDYWTECPKCGSEMFNI